MTTPTRIAVRLRVNGEDREAVVEPFLRLAEHPAAEMRQSAVRWLDRVRLTGLEVWTVRDEALPRGYDRVVVANPAAPPLWARFYYIATMRPIFGDKIRYFGAAHVSFAVALEDGLITPVIRDTHLKNIFQISTEAKSLGKLARDRKPASGVGGGR